MKRRRFYFFCVCILAISITSCELLIIQDKSGAQSAEENTDANVLPGDEVVGEGDFKDCKPLTETNQASDALPVQPGCYSGDLGADLPSGNPDREDWYTFEVQPGQIIQFVLRQPEKTSMTLGLYRPDSRHVGAVATVGNIRSLEYVADVGGTWWVKTIQNSGSGKYFLDFKILDQNDAGSGKDAGSASEALKITPGLYAGFLKTADDEDWYTFDVSVNKNIHLELIQPEKTSITFSLIRPNSKQAGSVETIGNVRTLTHIADMDGGWFIKVKRNSGEGEYSLKLEISD